MLFASDLMKVNKQEGCAKWQSDLAWCRDVYISVVLPSAVNGFNEVREKLSSPAT